LVAPWTASMWMSQEVTSIRMPGTVRCERSTLPVGSSWTTWFRESFLPTPPGTVATAFKPASQLNGPSNWTWHGFAYFWPGHVARVLVGSISQPVDAVDLTCTGTGITCRVSMLTAIGGGGWTLT